MWLMIYIVTTTYPFIHTFSNRDMCEKSRPAIEEDLHRYQTIPVTPTAITACIQK